MRSFGTCELVASTHSCLAINLSYLGLAMMLGAASLTFRWVLRQGYVQLHSLRHLIILTIFAQKKFTFRPSVLNVLMLHLCVRVFSIFSLTLAAPTPHLILPLHYITIARYEYSHSFESPIEKCIFELTAALFDAILLVSHPISLRLLLR